MNVHLLHPDRDFDRHQALPAHAADLIADLGLDVVIATMAGDDTLIEEIARRVLIPATPVDLETIRFRQAIVQDSRVHPDLIRTWYRLAGDALEAKRKSFFGFSHRLPSSILYGAIELLTSLIRLLEEIRGLAETHADRVTSLGLSSLCRTLTHELNPDYVARMRRHLDDLKFRRGVLIGARLGPGNESLVESLHEPPRDGPRWLARVFGNGGGLTVRVSDRDEAGARILEDLRNRGINVAANAVAQATDHVVSFFERLRAELAFYVGALNLDDALTQIGAPTCMPIVEPPGTRRLSSRQLYDIALALTRKQRPVANDLDADGKQLLVVTGANQGGKSTFLRSVGLAHVMASAGLFAGADRLHADHHSSYFTHYRREEDADLRHGKFDEELARVSTIADAIAPQALALFNESFASTDAREGSEIGTQIVRALLDADVTVVFVTHLYPFARGWFDAHRSDVLFLQPERLPDGTRTFRLHEAPPEETSYGEDVYAQVFGSAGRDDDDRVR
jgi:hypothetical protein